MITLHGFGCVHRQVIGETRGLRAQWALEDRRSPMARSRAALRFGTTVRYWSTDGDGASLSTTELYSTSCSNRFEKHQPPWALQSSAAPRACQVLALNVAWLI